MIGSRIDLDKHIDPRGALAVLESGRHVPFSIERVYYLYDLSANSERAGHAHKELRQLIIAVAGSFDVILDNGKDTETHHLHLPDSGLLIDPGVWRVINRISSDAICLVIASAPYDESDYYRDYDAFLESAK
jgi:hypothetical protein